MGFIGVSYYKWRYFKLVGGFSPTHLKNMRTSNWIIPPGRDENRKYLSCHHKVGPLPVLTGFMGYNPSYLIIRPLKGVISIYNC